ncbi:hypothetical protein FRC03_003197, partial [Tulasnella sp. 419]
LRKTAYKKRSHGVEANDAIKCAEFADNAHEKVLHELSELIEKHTVLEGSLRNHIDRLPSLSSATRQGDADNAASSWLVGEVGISIGELGNNLKRRRWRLRTRLKPNGVVARGKYPT